MGLKAKHEQHGPMNRLYYLPLHSTVAQATSRQTRGETVIPSGELYIGRIIRRYKHGYAVIWDYNRNSGLETADEYYERINAACPSPNELLGAIAVYKPDKGRRKAIWFTAFPVESLNQKSITARSAKTESNPELVGYVKEVLLAAAANAAGSPSLNVTSISKAIQRTLNQTAAG